MFCHEYPTKGRSERLEPCASKGARFLGEAVLATAPPYPTAFVFEYMNSGPTGKPERSSPNADGDFYVEKDTCLWCEAATNWLCEDEYTLADGRQFHDDGWHCRPGRCLLVSGAPMTLQQDVDLRDTDHAGRKEYEEIKQISSLKAA